LRIVQACFPIELTKKYDKSVAVHQKEAKIFASEQLKKIGILKNPELEFKIGELDNIMQVRQGIVLVGDT
jgi:type IV secretory pathway ATPase VirB11/archaellum biosynthesis ATPase